MGPPFKLCILLLQFCLVALIAALPTDAVDFEKPKEAYVSLLYGDTYSLPVRVMMRSLFVNSPDARTKTRDRIVLVTGETSESVKLQMVSDGITVETIPEVQTPYAKDSKFHSRFLFALTKIMVFNMTQYSKVLFIDADALVLQDLSAAFSCGSFCAVFINPCYFNSGFMVIEPNTTLFNDMLHELPRTPSYDGADQGFLNVYFSEMLDAPLFNDSEESLRAQRPLPYFSRLPFQWHVDHSTFFRSRTFTFDRSDRCGAPRAMEWLGPPLAKPWLWWTYVVLDLSWTWYEYRRQLPDSYPARLNTRRNAILVMLFCYAAFIIFLFTILRTNVFIFILRNVPSLWSSSINQDFLFRSYVPTLIGVLFWGFSFLLSVKVVPSILTPMFATVVFIHFRFLTSLWVLSFVGIFLCFGQHSKRSRSRLVASTSLIIATRQQFRRMAAWAILDALYLVVWSGLLWKVRFPSMQSKIFAVASVLATQGALVCVMMGDTTLSWVQIANMELGHV